MFRRAFSSRPQRRVTDYLADVLVRQGVKNVFGGHGGAVIPLVDSISSHPGLNWVYMRNEQAASLAAAADAKLTGRLAVCVATSGPGASHLTTGLVDALQVRRHARARPLRGRPTAARKRADRPCWCGRFPHPRANAGSLPRPCNHRHEGNERDRPVRVREPPSASASATLSARGTASPRGRSRPARDAARSCGARAHAAGSK